MLSILISIAFLLVSAGLWFASGSIPGATEWDIVGSRAIPQAMIVGMGVTSLVVLVQSVREWRLQGCPKEGLSALGRHRVAIVIFAAIFAWLALVRPLGFFTSALLFLLFLHWYLNGCRVSVAGVVVPFATLAAMYVVFVKFLKVMLPEGLFI